ncbi:MAG: ribosome-associated translation inhibitor RaiA [Candidatus Eisenbacteria bacterium]|nr:ribosome-associated translation inhibitor RaiA [Candidatus Eisenbacteria bacterium]
MRILITARHFDLTEGLREHTEERLEKLSKYGVQILESHVVLSVEKYRHIAEISLNGRGFTLNGKTESDDMYTSVDMVIQKLEVQLRRQKDKVRSRKGMERDPFARVDVVRPGESEDGEALEVLQSGEVTPDALSVEEAIRLLKESGEDYMLITDPTTERVTVVLRRNDGNFGVVEV